MASRRAGVMSVALGTGIGQAASVIAAALAAILFDPAALGVVGVVSGAGAILALLLGWRLELGLPAVRDDSVYATNLRHLRAVVRWTAASALIATAVSCLLWAVSAVSASTAAVAAGIPVAVAATIYYDAMSFAAVREQDYSAVGGGGLVLGVVQAGALIVGGVLWPVALVAVAAMPAGRGAAGYFLARKTSRAMWPGELAFAQVLRENRTHITSMVPSGLIIALIPSLPTFTLATSLGLASAGIFFTVQRLVAVPARLVAGAVSKVTYGSIGSGEEKGAVQKHIVGGLAFTVPAALLAVGAGLVTRRIDFGEYFGNEWADASLVVLPIAIGAAGQLLLAPFQFVLLSIGRQRLLLALHMFRLVLLLIACGVLLWADIGLEGAAWALSLAIFVGYVTMMIATALTVWRYHDWTAHAVRS